MTIDQNVGSHWSDARRQAWFQRHGRQHRVDVVVCGPPGCGKTSLIGALMYAAGIRTKTDVERVLTPLEGAGELAAKVYRVWREGGGQPPPPDGPQPPPPDGPHGFQVALGPAPNETALEVGLLELAAADVDAPEKCSRWQDVKDAAVLVLCVNAEGSDRDWYWRRLSRLSAQLAVATGGFVDRLGGERLRSPEGRPPLQAPRETRGYRQIVLLLTRTDAVIAGWSGSLGGERLARLPLGSQTGGSKEIAHQLALRVDVARWIEHLLGKHFIGQVRALLGGTGTELVVGLTSSRGLRQPTADLPEWEPFGVTELLDYLALGTPRPPFERVDGSGVDGLRDLPLRWIDSDHGGESA